MAPTREPAERTHEHRPAMGLGWMLPLYDPLTRVLGIPSVHRRLLERADVRAGHRVLDIGCGTGALTLLAKQTEPAAGVVGLDPDPAALSRARAKARSRSLDVHFDVGSSGSLPYPDGSMDRVLSAFMVHHLLGDELVRTLAEVRRVLRPEGSLHVVDFGGGADLAGMIRDADYSAGTTAHGSVLAAVRVTIIDALR